MTEGKQSLGGLRIIESRPPTIPVSRDGRRKKGKVSIPLTASPSECLNDFGKGPYVAIHEGNGEGVTLVSE